MSYHEHLEILRQGVTVWNQWRDPLLRVRAKSVDDLPIAREPNSADLVQANFREVDLRGADLRRSALGTTLCGANFIGANLSSANFSGQDLRGADLRAANLRNVVLHNTDLSEANLAGADLTHARLGHAELTKATVAGTVFGNVNLSEVKGLENVQHDGPSIIGIDTVYRSRGKIPEIFLQGAGVPDNFIEYMRSLVGETFEYYSCFISYSSKDQEFADRLRADLQAKGVRCWLATEDLKIGNKFRQSIDQAIRQFDKLVVVLSKASMKSDWVESEVETALERERADKGKKLVLFPIRLDGAVMKTKQAWAGDIRRMRHIGDFSAWQDHNSYKKALERLLRDLKGEQKKDAAAG